MNHHQQHNLKGFTSETSNISASTSPKQHSIIDTTAPTQWSSSTSHPLNPIAGPSFVRPRKKSYDNLQSISDTRPLLTHRARSEGIRNGASVTRIVTSNQDSSGDSSSSPERTGHFAIPKHRSSRRPKKIAISMSGGSTPRYPGLDMTNATLPPFISMTPASTTTPTASTPFLPRSQSLNDFPPSLAPLPRDPNNILPLSLPTSPYGSPSASTHVTPLHSPRGSIPDLHAEYTSASTSAIGVAGPSTQRSSSPRTSTSTTSSRQGWQSSSLTGRSDSRSSQDDDDSPILPSSSHGHGPFWFLRGDKEISVPVSPKVLLSSQSQILHPRIRLPTPTRLALPTGLRRCGWFVEPIRDFLLRSGDDQKRLSTKQQRVMERERLMAEYNGKKKFDPAPQARWFSRSNWFIPTTLWGVIAFLLGLACFGSIVGVTLKYILEPDKAPLPWRQYCSLEQPTLFSLQDSAAIRQSDAGSSLASYDLFGSSHSLTLQPITPQHSNWPYPGESIRPNMDFQADLSHIDPVGVFLGVFTYDSALKRRNMIRQSYGSHWRSRTEGTESVRVRFVMGRPRDRYKRAIELEQEAYGDLVVLDIPENMNSGKTHAFFSWAAENATVPYYDRTPSHNSASSAVMIGENKPQYIVKADDDSFIMLGELERRLRVAPRTKAYWGYLIKNKFMGGEAYGLSFDLVQYMAESKDVRQNTHGKEDQLVSRWINMHPEAKDIVWVSESCWIYDHPRAGTVYSHGFLYPSEVSNVRHEIANGLPSSTLTLRGGPGNAKTYSTVSKFGRAFRTLSKDMTAAESIESMVEGSPLSQLRDSPHFTSLTSPIDAHDTTTRETSRRNEIEKLFATRPSRLERFLGDPLERGGTVVVHYIKKPQWFIETMVALLGPAEDIAHHVPGHGHVISK